MAPASGAETRSAEERLVRVFCDADVLIAGSASTRGASHILLQLSELTLIDCISSRSAIDEAERSIASKLPAALSAFRKIIAAAIHVVPEAPPRLSQSLAGQAHPKDIAILSGRWQAAPTSWRRSTSGTSNTGPHRRSSFSRDEWSQPSVRSLLGC